MKQVSRKEWTGLIFLFVMCCMFPSKVFGAVLITEIMYDLPGSDTGREWVEVTNTGSDSVDVSNYKLSEGDTNHTLTILSGAPALAGGQSAVIVSNADKFAADWPQFSGTMFKSSFSLSNTGETLSLKDKSLTLLDSASYTSDGGAAGDGNTLHRVGDTLVAGAPDPGVFASATTPAPAPDPTPAPAPTPDPAPNTGTAPTSDTTTSTPAADSSSTATTSTSSDTTTQSDTSTPPTTATTVTPEPTTQTPAPQTSTTPTQPVSTQTTSTPTPAPAVKTKTSSTAMPAATVPVVPTSTAPAIQPTHAVSVAAASKPSSSGGKSTSRSSSSQSTFKDSNTQVAAVAMAPLLQNIPSIYLYIFGLTAIIVLGVGAVMYIKPESKAAAVTASTQEEFELE